VVVIFVTALLFVYAASCSSGKINASWRNDGNEIGIRDSYQSTSVVLLLLLLSLCWWMSLLFLWTASWRNGDGADADANKV